MTSGFHGRFGCPPLLVAVSVQWLAHQIVGKQSSWKTVITVGGGIVLSAIGGVFLEALPVLGAFSMNFLSGDFLKNWDKRGQTVRGANGLLRMREGACSRPHRAG